MPIHIAHIPALSDLHIQESPLAPLVRYYHVSDDTDSREIDAYVADFSENAVPDALYVVLVPADRGSPPYVYAPAAGMYGVSHETAIRLALEACRAQQP